MTRTSHFSDMTSSTFFWRRLVSPVKFSYWSKFHVNIVTGSKVMTISFYEGLTRNPEIGKYSCLCFAQHLETGRVKNTKFGKSVSNKMLLNAAKCQGCSFYRFWNIKGKPTRVVKLPPTQIRVKTASFGNILKKIVTKSLYI